MPGRSSVPSATSAAFLRGAACHSRRGPKLYRPVRTGRCAMPRKRLGVRFCRMLRRITAVFRIRSRLSARCTSIQHYSSGETLPCVRQPGAIKTVFGGSHRRRVPARRSAPARPVARHRHAAQRRWPAPRVGGKEAMGDGAASPHQDPRPPGLPPRATSRRDQNSGSGAPRAARASVRSTAATSIGPGSRSARADVGGQAHGPAGSGAGTASGPAVP